MQFSIILCFYVFRMFNLEQFLNCFCLRDLYILKSSGSYLRCPSVWVVYFLTIIYIQFMYFWKKWQRHNHIYCSITDELNLDHMVKVVQVISLHCTITTVLFIISKSCGEIFWDCVNILFLPNFHLLILVFTYFSCKEQYYMWWNLECIFLSFLFYW